MFLRSRALPILLLALLLSACASGPPPRQPSPPDWPGGASRPERPASPATPPVVRDPRTLPARLVPDGVADRKGWIDDLMAAFSALDVPLRADNLCAVIAVTEQESGFVADPVVPGLPAIVWKELEVRRSRYHVPRVVMDTALDSRSADGRSYKQRIDALRTEREMNDLYGEMSDELPFGRTLLASHNPVRTGGPMQVSVAFAEAHAREHPYPFPLKGSIRDEVFTRRGGLYFGTAILLGYPAPYEEMRFRFADFNAGRYSSRNAAFQSAVARLSGRALALDGDLLRYADGEVAREPSQTLTALLGLARRLGMERRRIEADLRREKERDFSETALYRKVFELAEQRGQLPRALMPEIQLKSPKITRKLTTEWFAERVDGRYRRCLQRE